MVTIRERYQSALKELPPDVSVNDLRLLLVEHLHFSNYAELDLNFNQELTDLSRFESDFNELKKGKPVQYIVRNANFYGRDYYVDERVLIPRPETEELVGLVLKELAKTPKKEQLILVDVGTGSGVIAIECAKRLNADVHAIDISDDALEVAKINANNHHADITFHQGDLLTPLVKKKIKVDIIVSNPPYINPKEKLDKKVFDYEPHLALFAQDGIDNYRKILQQAQLIKKDQVFLFFEIGEQQEKVLTSFLKLEFPGAEYKFTRDLQRKTRFLQVKLHEE
ncbi:MAG: peptide chain release factor N(5)-glutamine methyltransferase [Bacilli bacterium]|jgi:release factor glutamine methyltransferase